MINTKFKTIGLSALALILAFGISCSKKPKTDASAEGGALSGSESVKIDSTPLSFDPAGSDSEKIAGLKTVRFAYDSSTLDGAARQNLVTNAAWLKSNNNISVQVEGHCDSRGSVEYNLALGGRRAKTVKDYLVSLGVEATRLREVSYGKEKLLDYADSEDAHAKNRRANFLPLSQ